MNAQSEHRRSYLLIWGVALSAFSLFFLYEVVEATWLADASEGTLRELQRARAILVSLVLVIAALVATTRHRPTPFPSIAGVDAAGQTNSLAHLADWFLWMRWLACATAAVLVLVAVEVSHLLPRTLLMPLLGCIAILALFNCLFTLLLVHYPGGATLQVAAQVVLDLAALTALLHFSGGIENPLSLLYLFHVIIAGILFSRRSCYFVALGAFVMFGLLVGLEYLEILPHYTLEIFPHAEAVQAGAEDLHAAHYGPYVLSRIFLQGLILLPTAYFITTIMERLRKRERDARSLARSEREARLRLESVVDAAGAGLRLLDSNLRPTWTNTKFEEWAPEADAAIYVAARTMADGKLRSREHQVELPGGRTRYFATTTACMPGAEDQERNIVQLVQDVTARKQAEAEAIHAGKLAAVGELAANLAHEINNPLGILSARIHLLLKSGDSMSAKAVASLNKMSGLVDRISSITRALLGHVRLDHRERRALHVQPLLDRASDLMKTWASKKSIRFSFNVSAGAPTVVANAVEIEQVLINLLMNAVDVSPVGGTVAVDVCAAALESGKEVLRFTVEDAGPGVPDSLHERIFEPFFSTKKAGEGTGLGLSLSQRIVKDHGGRLWVEHGATGARFVFDIPTHVPTEP